MNVTHARPSLLGGMGAVVLVGAMAAKGPPEMALLQRTAPSGEAARLADGTRAPDLRLATVDGGSVGLEVLRGGESVLVFVTPTCPYCRELKTQVLARELPEVDGRLVFVTRSTVDSTAPAEVAQLEARLAARYPVAVDSEGSAFEAYRARGVPTTYLIDGEGRVSASAVGVPGGLALIDRFVRNRSTAARLAALDGGA